MHSFLQLIDTFDTDNYTRGVQFEKLCKWLLENHIEASEWYRKATVQGHVKAQQNLGALYASGDGVPKNKIRAYVWLSIAQALGDDKAAGNIDMLKSDMSPDQISQAQALITECYESNFENCE
ncbi:sel1 repeat family protein [Porticoccaceae bacterium]|nr:sel1 repeat family protein [Porticoccaceae bacterium]MDC1477464.1 sel1 repeat family protein [Porticoccaceae bacterium]